MTFLGGALTLAGLSATALPGYLEYRRKPIAALRDKATGAFADLSQGKTHYRWSGPKEAPVALCIHGLTTPSFVWEGLTPHLLTAGYRVLTYDLYGRGFSDAPCARNTAQFFTRQLRDLLDHQGVDAPVTLIGYSMGGAIAASFAAAHPERTERVILIAPAGMGHDLGQLARFTRDVPLLGDWAFHLGYPSQLRTGIEAERDQPGSVENIADRQLAQLDRRGYLRSVLSSLRGQLGRPLEVEHRRIAANGTPVTAIWGREDRTIPIRAKDTLALWNRNARQEVIDSAGHGLPYTHTRQLAQAIARMN
ncbi:alpha/beta fold hydrolase [Antarctobacter jejuensis]|uniref:alpha/beta fold hydrolase n=1 Tax=Antarctobacter jejuensis TaxID=1439938 RepID=UPI003FCF9776